MILHFNRVMLLSLTTCLGGSFLYAKDKTRPNIVWFMAEDVYKHYYSLYNAGMYGVETPHLEALAEDGILFTNAYSNAPVSSAARSTLITGCYAPTYGASFHRKLLPLPLDEKLAMFPTYLRKAGYHTSNAAKTDYNFSLDVDAWDVINGQLGEWRQRKSKDQPFFFVRTSVTTHESSLHFPADMMYRDQTEHKPSSIHIAPYHPDTELFRHTYASFYDRISRSDRELGELVAMLKADGELENTFIFYFGDNGGALPGTKGYLTEGGINVPLVVYIPKRWRNAFHIKGGSTTNGIVSFMDFAPTVLALAGLSVPEAMEGSAFLNKDMSLTELNQRDEAICYADRFDELYAFSRSIRKGNYKYVRNFQAYQPKSLFAFYRYKQAAFQEWKALYTANKLTPTQARFFEPQAVEELYDLSADPYETHNLALDSSYSLQLKHLRSTLKEKLVRANDLGFIPEFYWLENSKTTTPKHYGEEHKDAIARYATISEYAVYPFKEVKEMLQEALLATDPLEQYWAATTCASFGKQAQTLASVLRKLTRSKDAYVASRAWVALANMDKADVKDVMIPLLHKARSGAETLLILNDMAYLYELDSKNKFNISTTDIKHNAEGVSWRVNYLNK